MIYSQQLDFRRGANERDEGVCTQYMTDDERICNKAEDSSAKSIDKMHAHEAAINLLAIREHSAFELKKKLTQRGYDSIIINNVLEAVKANNYQSDERFLAAFCNSKIRKGYGILYIVQALKLHKIPSSTIYAFLSEQNWVEIAKLVLKKHAWRFQSSKQKHIYSQQPDFQQDLSKAENHAFCEGRGSSAQSIKVKKTKFLMARGFTQDVIKESLLYEDC